MSEKSATSAGPLGPITMGLSGGGYRAASFHLGTFAYLQHLDVLKDVQVISTVSGGTIIGAAYAASLTEADFSFEGFFNRFYDILAKANIIDGAFDKIGKVNTNTYAGYDDLITSIAQAYDNLIFKGARFEIFWDEKPIHLKEIVFNATEFRTADAFRFQKSEDPQAIIGSTSVAIDRMVAGQIRLADIVASSSCFPGGFEPLVFPGDFQWPDNKVPGQLEQDLEHPLPLMDGGVYDNQGIDGMMRAVDRQRAIHAEQNYPGLAIISDTDQFDDDIYDVVALPDHNHRQGFSVTALKKVGFIIFGLSALSFVFLLYEFIQRIGEQGVHWSNSLAFVFPIIVVGILAFGLFWLYLKIGKVKSMAQDQVPQLHADDWAKFAKLSLDQVLELINMRVTSVMALTSRIFMRNVRRLFYDRLNNDPSYENKRIANLIYTLANDTPPAQWLNTGLELKAIASRAAGMPTTLWFDDTNQLNDIVICGQSTICYEILTWIIDTYGEDTAAYPPEIETLFDRARQDWARFNSEPNWLLSELRK